VWARVAFRGAAVANKDEPLFKVKKSNSSKKLATLQAAKSH
jgi:hypothetical protein